MLEKNNLKPLQKMRYTIEDVRKQMNVIFRDVTFLAKETDFDDLLAVRAELKDTIRLSTSLFEQWIERKMPTDDYV